MFLQQPQKILNVGHRVSGMDVEHDAVDDGLCLPVFHRQAADGGKLLQGRTDDAAIFQFQCNAPSFAKHHFF